MKLKDFRVGLRVLAQDPAYTIVSILGLGVGLGVCILLLAYARYSWQYNAHVPDADHVYIVKQRDNVRPDAPWYDQVPLFLRAAARTAPGVVDATAYVGWAPLTVEVDGELHKLGNLTVLSRFGEMLGLRVIAGDLSEALSRPDAIAITEGKARRLFGTSDVLGRALQLRLSAVDENRSSARIAAIVADPPANTTIPFESLNGPNVSLMPPELHAELVGESEWMGYVLVRLRPGHSPRAVDAVLQQLFDAAPSTQRTPPETRERLGGRPVRDIELSRLRDAYFDREVTTDWLSLRVDRGNAAVVTGLVAVAVLILVLAAVNYINLTTIRVVRRQREIAMRKVLGASSARLAHQFAAESLIVSLLATGAGFLLAWLALPVFAALMNRELGSILTLEYAGIALGLGVVIGLVTTLYPAWIAFGVRPSVLLMGRPDTESSGGKRLRQSLSVLQMCAAMGLASYTLAIAWQAQFAINASPGFDPAPLVVFDLPTAVSANEPKPRALIAELSQRAEVAGIAVSNDQVGRAQESWRTEIKRDGQSGITVDVKTVSANFFEEYGIRPTAGRLFDPTLDKPGDSVPVVINAIAARQLGFEDPRLAVGQPLLFKSVVNEEPAVVTKRVVGIAPEVRFYSLRAVSGPVAYDLSGSGPGWDGTLTVRARHSTADAERAIRETWPRYFPNSVVDIQSARMIYAANYADDDRLAKMLGLATIVALAIAGFGLYVLTADAVQRRAKEIALRKLFGSRGRDIGKLVALEVGAVIAMSAVIALPLAALAIGRYLAVFTESTPHAYWALALAPLASLLIAAIAAARQAWIAMTLKPAVALRS